MNIAMIYKPVPDCQGYPGFLERGIRQIHETTHYLPGEEEPGYDQYYYVDDGPTAYMEPKYRPATYFAMDMVVKPFWYLDPVEHYFERLGNFDAGFVTSTASLRYCQERGMDVRLSGFAADPEYHQPAPVERVYDWVAVWHNCGDRVHAAEAAMQHFPNGRVSWAGEKVYAQHISEGRCALNWLRGDIVNMRVFEVMACGTPLINSRHLDMDTWGFVEGQHYLGFDCVDEMLYQIGWVQENPVKAEIMAQNARQFVLATHTYYHRALEIFNANEH